MSQIKLPEDEVAILLSFFPHGVVCFDLETTGLSPLTDRIIEIGALKVTPQGEVKIFQTLINPQCAIPEKTQAIHHISDDMVKDAPLLESILPQFVTFTENLPLVAHNAMFDIGFLIFAFYQKEVNWPESAVYDSCRLGRKAISNVANYKLATLAEKMDVGLENHHRAHDDAYACLRIFAQSLQRMTKVSSIDQVSKAALLFRSLTFFNKIDLHLPPQVHPLIQKIPHQEIVEIQYQGGSHRNAFRPIRPISFIPLPQGVVLYAYCILSQMHKSFVVKKIHFVKSLSEEERLKWQEHGQKSSEKQ